MVNMGHFLRHYDVTHPDDVIGNKKRLSLCCGHLSLVIVIEGKFTTKSVIKNVQNSANVGI